MIVGGEGRGRGVGRNKRGSEIHLLLAVITLKGQQDDCQTDLYLLRKMYTHVF